MTYTLEIPAADAQTLHEALGQLIHQHWQDDPPRQTAIAACHDLQNRIWSLDPALFPDPDEDEAVAAAADSAALDELERKENEAAALDDLLAAVGRYMDRNAVINIDLPQQA